MSQNSTTTTNAPSGLDAAFDALNSYASGSSRGALCPIDDAVIQSLPEPKARAAMETRLVGVLKAKPSAEAVEYICSKLALVGSGTCVPVLIELIAQPETSTVVRNTLEKIPGPAASKALRKALPGLDIAGKIGAILSLGACRDTASVGLLAGYLSRSDGELAATSAWALGRVGTAQAAKALKKCITDAPLTRVRGLGDAALACAERLLATDKRSEAKALYQVLAASAQPAQVQKAAARGLLECASARPQSAGT